jgi:hypothetical protein
MARERAFTMRPGAIVIHARIALAGLAWAISLQTAAAFESKAVPLSHPANGDLVRLEGSPYIAVTGHSASERWLSLVDVGSLTAHRVDVPEGVQFIAAGRVADAGAGAGAGAEAERLLLLGAGGVSLYSPQTGDMRPLLETASIYRGADAKRLRSLAFVKDVTGNGLSDLLIPDFAAFYVFVQVRSGGFERFVLPIDAEMRTLDGVVSYAPREPHVVDFTLDGRLDIVFVLDGRLLVFRQHREGRIDETPLIHALGIPVTPDLEADLRPGDGRDFAGLVVHRVEALEDLDGDGLADLVVLRQHYQDGIDQHDSYRVHYGRRGDAGLVFAGEPDAHIETRGVQLEPIFEDVNGNGRRDFGVASASIGLGTIIRALITGSAGMDVLFYAMRDGGQFGPDPDYRQSARVEISLRSRQVDLPLVRLADLEGTGRRSLLVGEGRDVLWIYSADANGLFAPRGERVRIGLPRDTGGVLVTDLTGNGRDDLVLPFGTRDGGADRYRLELLLTR